VQRANIASSYQPGSVGGVNGIFTHIFCSSKSQ